ncbi:MAG: DNA repair protein RecN [Clostridia bacterium]|nr:DNA repair protein RecN [Clostridia bacterium]
MIKSLELKNIALIDHAIIDFEKGLNVLSGETGSGKSVIVDSINFVLGAKADKSMIRHGESECFASVIFDVSQNATAKEILADLDVEFDDEVIVSRKFTADSKSVIRVNGVPFTLGMLRSVTQSLVDVHGQSDHYSLMKRSEQLKVLDKFSDKSLLDLKERCRLICKELTNTDELLSGFGGSEQERAIRADILKFQIDEIEGASLVEGEEDELIIKRKKIQSAEKIAQSLSTVKSAILNDGCITDILNEAIRSLNQISSIDEKYEELYNRLIEVSADITDIGYLSDDYLSDVEFSEGEADAIEDRLDKIKSLKKKYGSTVEEIFEFLSKVQEEYNKLINFDNEYERLILQKSRQLKMLNECYHQITEVRRASSKTLCERVLSHLKQLGMKDASFEIIFNQTSEVEDAPYHENGNDEIEFAFSANLGEPTKPLSKIISGGEMSRFMLALKAIVCEYQDISTYIFDEIDVGISGKTAETVAEKFADISRSVQVIAISHLPQICAFSDVSFAIEKFADKEKTHTKIIKLSSDKKIDEIVRIIGGSSDSEPAKLHAKEMLERAKLYKS